MNKWEVKRFRRTKTRKSFKASGVKPGEPHNYMPKSLTMACHKTS